MKNYKQYKSPDAFFWEISRYTCILLAVGAVYVLAAAVRMYEDPSLAPGMFFMIPEMIKHILVGCAAIPAVGALFEYIIKKEQFLV